MLTDRKPFRSQLHTSARNQLWKGHLAARCGPELD